MTFWPIEVYKGWLFSCLKPKKCQRVLRQRERPTPSRLSLNVFIKFSIINYNLYELKCQVLNDCLVIVYEYIVINSINTFNFWFKKKNHITRVKTKLKLRLKLFCSFIRVNHLGWFVWFLNWRLHFATPGEPYRYN